jgi:hypothetical protein
MVLQEEVEKMLLTQETSLAGKTLCKTLCLLCSLRVMPSFWRRASESQVDEIIGIGLLIRVHAANEAEFAFVVSTNTKTRDWERIS